MERTGYLIALVILILAIPGTLGTARSDERDPSDPTRADTPSEISAGTTLFIHDTLETLNTSYHIKVPEGGKVLSCNMSISPAPLSSDPEMYPTDMWFKIGKIGNSFEHKSTASTGEPLGQWGRQTFEVGGKNYHEADLSAGASTLKMAIPKDIDITSFTLDISGNQREDDHIRNEIPTAASGDGTGAAMVNAGRIISGVGDVIIAGSPGGESNFGGLYRMYYSSNTFLYDTMAVGPDQLSDYGTSISDPFKISSSVSWIAVGAPNGGKLQEGTVLLYNVKTTYGSNSEDYITGNDTQEDFGTSVASGDVDGDGWGEIVVGSPGANSGEGKVYVLKYDTTSPDFSTKTSLLAVIPNTFGDTGFGRMVSCGDMDGDGIEDIAVASEEAVRVYLGSSTFNTGPDLELDPLGVTSSSDFSFMAFIGDDDGDSTDTISVGAPTATGGKVIIYRGSDPLDSIGDLTLTSQSIKKFGTSVSNVFDVSGDGSLDIAIGCPDPGSASQVSLYTVSGTGAGTFAYSTSGAMYGNAVILGADLRADGYHDICVGAPFKEGATNYGIGRLVVEEYYDASDLEPNQPSLRIGGTEVWKCPASHLNGSISTGDISSSVQPFLSGISINDTFTNKYNDFIVLPLEITSATSDDAEGSLMFNITSFTLIYDQNKVLTGLADKINNELDEYPPKEGYHVVDLRFLSLSPGGLMVDSYSISFDHRPAFTNYPKVIEVPEDTHEPKAMDIFQYLTDDITPLDELEISVGLQSSQKSENFTVGLTDGRYLSVDAFNDTAGGPNDNETAELKPIITIKDSSGLITSIRDIVLRITPVNDPPAMTNVPGTKIKEDVNWTFNPQMIDAEKDRPSFTIEGPSGMYILNGRQIVWVTDNSDVGENRLDIILSDGNDTRTYTYILEVENVNDDPVFVEVPPGDIDIYIGDTYEFTFIAADIDMGDSLTYYLREGEGATIDRDTGLFRYAPAIVNPNPIKFTVSAVDKKESEVSHSFYIKTLRRLSEPEVISEPETELSDLQPWYYTINVYEPNGDVPQVSLHSGPKGMVFESIRNRFSWTPGIDQVGAHDISIMVNGSGFSVYHNFTLIVSRSERTWSLDYNLPLDGEKVTGTIKVTGSVGVEPGTIVSVQISIDDKDWFNISLLQDAFSYDLDTNDLPDGDHTINVRAFDGFQYSPERTRTINVANHEGEIAWWVYILIALGVLAALAVIGYLGFIIYKANERREEEKAKAEKMAELKKSKDDMDRFCEENIEPGKEEGGIRPPEVEAMDLEELIHKTDGITQDERTVSVMGAGTGTFNLDGEEGGDGLDPLSKDGPEP